MTKRNKIFTIIFVIVCLVVAIYSSCNIVNWKKDVNENQKINDKINLKIKIIDLGDKGTKYDIDFASLKEINADTVAYLKVNNTNIDYVVVKGSNNETYLNHNFYNNYNIAGWIFGDYHNKFDGTDKNIIIYGHNMQDGSMFGSLENIFNEEWQKNEDNRKITLVTEKNTYYYEIFSVYSIIPEDYYITTSFNDYEFDDFVNKLKARSIYDYNVNVDGSDKILTLSSCTNDGFERIVLHAKLIS